MLSLCLFLRFFRHVGGVLLAVPIGTGIAFVVTAWLSNAPDVEKALRVKTPRTCTRGASRPDLVAIILISRAESVIVSLKKQAGRSFAFRLPCLATRAWSRAKPKMPRKAANSRCGLHGRRKRKKRRGRRKGGRVLIPRGPGRGGGGPGWPNAERQHCLEE